MLKYVVIGILLFTNLILAQNTLSLDVAIDIAMDQSFNIKRAKYSFESSQKSLEAVKLGLLSSVDLEFLLPDYTNKLTSAYDFNSKQYEYYKQSQINVMSKLKITQPVMFTNGTIRLEGSLLGRSQKTINNLSKRDYFSDIAITLNQPLFEFNSQRASLERAEINQKKSERNFTQSEFNIIYQVTSSFYSLYKAREQVTIAKEEVKQNELSYKTALNKYKAGLIPETEAMNLEVELAQSKNSLLDTERRYEELKNDFKFLIGLNLEENIKINADINFKKVNIDLAIAIKNALKNRPDLLNAKDEIKLKKLNVEETDARHSVKASLYAKYGVNKNEEEFGDLFSNLEDNRQVQMTVSVPILDWGKNSREVEAAEANLKISQETHKNINKSIKKEVISLFNKMKSAEAKVEVLSKSVNVAQKTYEISIERFKAGKITSFELSQSQLRLTNAKLSNLSALIDYKLAVADLERKTLSNYN